MADNYLNESGLSYLWKKVVAEITSATSTFPTIATSKKDGVTTITFTGKDGTIKTATINDGATGPQGPAGKDGADGAAGPTGKDGKTYTPQIGTVSTLAAGSQATVKGTVDDTNNTFTFDFGIPKGADGAGGSGGGVTPDISMTASVDAKSSDAPSVVVTKSGTNEAPNFDFAFSGLKGKDGSSSGGSSSSGGGAPKWLVLANGTELAQTTGLNGQKIFDLSTVDDSVKKTIEEIDVWVMWSKDQKSAAGLTVDHFRNFSLDGVSGAGSSSSMLFSTGSDLLLNNTNVDSYYRLKIEFLHFSSDGTPTLKQITGFNKNGQYTVQENVKAASPVGHTINGNNVKYPFYRYAQNLQLKLQNAYSEANPACNVWVIAKYY